MAASYLPLFLQKLTNWMSRSPVLDQGPPLVPLPPNLEDALQAEVSKLPPPEPYRIAIQQAFLRAFEAWKADPDIGSNCLVVLGRPVEAIAPILKTSFAAPILTNCEISYHLTGYQRPPDPLTILEHIKREFEAAPVKSNLSTRTATQGDATAADSVVVVPNLDPCFLRCIQGWEGIEYFETLSGQDTSRFWVFGCNHWAWAFLDRVCQVSAYLEESVTFPRLTGEDLRTWLAPLAQFVVELDEAKKLDIQIGMENDAYWTSLANLATGSSTTAAHLWLRSLRLAASQVTQEGGLLPGSSTVPLIPTKPSLPELIPLEVMDRYLLHSLLIHGEMTRSHLALSLGVAERLIRSRIQVLSREGMIRQRGLRLSVHPAFYPKLFTELESNNFLIGQA